MRLATLVAASETEISKAQDLLDFAEQAFPPHLRHRLPNESLIQSNAITDNHYAMSGKVAALQMMCKKFKAKR